MEHIKQILSTTSDDKKLARIRNLIMIGFVVGVLCMVFVTVNMLFYQAKYYDKQIEQLKSDHEAEVTRLKMEYSELNTKYTKLEEDYNSLEAIYTASMDDIGSSESEIDIHTIAKYADLLKILPKEATITLGMIQETDTLCKQLDVNPDIIWTIMGIESKYQVAAQNKNSTARGLGQILKDTGRRIYENVMGNGAGTYNHAMAYNGYTNIAIMVNYVAYLKENYGNIKVMINGYSGDQSGGYYSEFARIMQANGRNLNQLGYSS